MKQHKNQKHIQIPETLLEWVKLYALCNNSQYHYVSEKLLHNIFNGNLENDTVDIVLFYNSGGVSFDIFVGDSVAEYIQYTYNNDEDGYLHAYRVAGKTTILQYPIISTVNNKSYLVSVKDKNLVNVKQS